MKSLSLLFTGLFLLGAVQVKSQVTEKNYKIYSVKLAKEVSINDIIAVSYTHLDVYKRQI